MQTLSKSLSTLCLRDFSADRPACEPGKIATAPCCGSRQIESFIAGWGGDDDTLAWDSCGLDTAPFVELSASLLVAPAPSKSAAVFCCRASLNCLWQLALQNSMSSASSSDVAYRHNNVNVSNYQQFNKSSCWLHIHHTTVPLLTEFLIRKIHSMSSNKQGFFITIIFTAASTAPSGKWLWVYY